MHDARSEQQQKAVRDVLSERRRQDDQWGVQNHHPAYWLAILGKQVGQFGAAVLDREWAAINAHGRTTAAMREEAVQVAAVALAIIECIDAGDMPVDLATAKPANPRQLAKALGRGDESLDYEAAPGIPWHNICACGSPATTHSLFLHDAEIKTDTIGEPGSEPCS